MMGLSLTLASLVLVNLAIYRLFFHPLARIPGPKLAGVSNVWQARHVRDGRARELGKTLHTQYGHVVRVGPNEVWFDSEEAFREIYGAGHGYEKSDFYLATALNKPRLDWKLRPHFPDTLDFLSEFDVRRYRMQRRLIGPLYQASSIRRFDAAVDRVIAAAITELKALDGAEVDLKEWMHIIAVECLGAVVLSWSPRYIQTRSDGGTSTQSYLGWKRKSVFGLFPTITRLSFISKTLSRAFAIFWGVTFKTPKGFKPFFTPVYQKTSKRIANALGPTTRPGAIIKPRSTNDLLENLISLHKEKPEFNETYLRRLAVTNFGAGHETMCSALTAAMAMIGSHHCVQRRVVDETRSNHKASGASNGPRLRYTQASIKEAQRFYPVIGMSLSRKVPKGGTSLHGFYFPAGTTVGCNPVALHFNPDIFGDDAGRYNPDRWLQDDSMVRRMERINLTWGGGARSCPGRHLAELVVHKVVPALFREFDLEITVMPEETEMPTYFMAMMTGVKAKFHRVPRNYHPCNKTGDGGVEVSESVRGHLHS
ncbi:hypothetical protein VTH06DRAFT_7506 [Thermothelomyces fergusii]